MKDTHRATVSVNVAFDEQTNALSGDATGITASFSAANLSCFKGELNTEFITINEENTTHTWLTLNGCSGYAFRSRKEGYTNRFIFLPANGIISPSYQAPNNAGISGFYWSRTVDDRVADISFYLHFTKHGSITIESEDTSSRLSLRKVVSKQLN